MRPSRLWLRGDNANVRTRCAKDPDERLRPETGAVLRNAPPRNGRTVLRFRYRCLHEDTAMHESIDEFFPARRDAADCNVGLSHIVRVEGATQGARAVRVEAEAHAAGGFSIDAVDWEHFQLPLRNVERTIAVADNRQRMIER